MNYLLEHPRALASEIGECKRKCHREQWGLMLHMRFNEEQFSQKTIPKLVRMREKSTAALAPFAGGWLLSFQCCLRANGVSIERR